jgi:hypothetical protein
VPLGRLQVFGLTALMDFDAPARIATDSPLTLVARGYSGEAAIPESSHLESASSPPRRPGRFVVDLWACVVRNEFRNGVGLSPVSVVSHCEQATPPTTLRVEGNSRDASFESVLAGGEDRPMLQQVRELGITA